MSTILVVDDSETIRSQLAGDLKEAGYDVLEAADGEQGLEKAVHETVDLIITDYNMPKMDGLSMCTMIKEKNGDKKVPIFMLTTQSRADLKARAKDVGVLAWILKPYQKAALLKATSKVLPH